MFRRIVALIVCIAFISTQLQYSYAQGFDVKQLPKPGSVVAVSPVFMPLTLKGLVLHPDNALKFDFLMDTGNSRMQGEALNTEALKIMTYFLTAMTMPEEDMWVNLSPYEKGKMIENNFGNTVMGRDLLAEDYVLKQLTASLVYPEKTLGKKFWGEIYGKLSRKELEEVALNSFNKVWIVPSQAVVWEHDGKVMIVKSHLRVMLEEDYVALKNDQNVQVGADSKHTLASQIVREVIIPVLEKQVNEGEHFAYLRQMYQAMILATWYKKALKESILTKVYANQRKIKGVDNANPGDIEMIYQQYLDAFKKGAFNYIREDIDSKTGQVIPRKYFSGGFTLKMGIVSLATALTVWSGTPTNAQAEEISRNVAKPVGNTVLVQGFAAEADLKGRPILLAQESTGGNGSKLAIVDKKMEQDKKEVLKLLRSAKNDSTVKFDNSMVPALLEILKKGERSMRLDAALALSNIGGESVIYGLIDAKKNDPVERVIDDALIKIGRPAVPILFEELVKTRGERGPRSWDVRSQIAHIITIVGIDDKSYIPALHEALGDDNSEVRNFASDTLEKLEASWWLKQSNNEQLLWIMLAAGIGLLGVAGLARYFVSATHRRVIVNKLYSKKKKNEILQFLDDKDAGVRAEAREALEYLINNPEDLYLIGLSQLTGKNLDNQIWGIEMLAKAKDSRALEPLANLLNSSFNSPEDYMIYNAASDALYLFGDVRSEFRYEYRSEEGHFEGYATHDHDATYVVDKEAHWEKVKRTSNIQNGGSILGGSVLKIVIVALATALYFLHGQPTYAQQVGYNQAVEQKMRSAFGDSGRGQPILLAQATSQDNLNPSNIDNDAQLSRVKYMQFLLDKNREWDGKYDGMIRTREPGILEVIKYNLANNNSRTRFNAEFALKRWYETSELSKVLVELKDYRLEVRYIAIQALGNIGDKRAIPDLIVALKDINSVIRSASANSLGQIKDNRVVPELIVALRDQVSDVRTAAAIALGMIEDKTAVPELILVLKDKDSAVRVHGVEALGKIRDKIAVPALIELLNDKASDVRQSVVVALGKMGDARAVSHLILASHDGESAVRMGIAESLGIIQDSKAIPGLLELLRDPVAEVRQAANVALIKFGQPAISGLVEQVNKNNGVLVSAAIEVLEEIGSKEAIAALHDIYSNGNVKSKELALKALDRLQVSWWQKQSDLAQWVWLAFAAGLGLLGIWGFSKSDSYKKKVLGRLLRNKRYNEIEKFINNLLNNGNLESRLWAISMIAKSGDKRAADLIANFLSDKLNDYEAYTLYNAASDALFEMGDSRARYRYVFHPVEGYWDNVQLSSTEFNYEFIPTGGDYWEKIERSINNTTDNQSESSVGYSSGITIPEKLGGITLDPQIMNLQIKRDGNNMPLPVSQQPLDKINLQGFVPQIINIQPVNLVEFLSLNTQDDDNALAKI